MDKLIIRELREYIGGTSVTVLSIFIVGSNLGIDEFDSVVSAFLTKNSAFERAHLVGFKKDIRPIIPWLAPSEDSGTRLRKVLRDFESSFSCVVFDEATGTHQVTDLALNTNLNHPYNIINAERRASLLQVFERANGMMVAPTGFHYGKTSKAHSDRFIRASNSIEAAENVAQLAFWILPAIWASDVDQIVVDTSGIYAPILLASHYRSVLKKVPNLQFWSHRSFDGLEAIEVIPKTAVCLISATTSGTLSMRLKDRGADPNRIWTIYGLVSRTAQDKNILCDLWEGAAGNTGGHPLIENYEAHNCRLCKEGSLAVRISGDQFVLEPPQTKEIDIVIGDISDQLRAILSEVVGTGLFKVYRHRLGRRAGQHEIYLDVQSLFEYLQIPAAVAENAETRKCSDKLKLSSFWQKFKNSWSTLKKRAATFNVERIVNVAYPFSIQLSQDVLMEFHQSLRKPKVLPQKQLSLEPESDGSGTIVVASCLDDPQELMTIKRDLRDIQKFGTTWFIAPFLRGPTSDIPEQHRRLIGYGEFGPGTISLHHCQMLVLPDCQTPNSWEIELDTLREMSDWLLAENESVPTEISIREQLLRTSITTGFSNGIFWPASNGTELKLRNDFTLVPSDKPFSQADVFCVISVYLHCLRAPLAGEKRLLYTPFARSVVAPSVFTKFNDGVLQAAILRSARGHELHYANSDGPESEAMFSILMDELEQISYGRGEALMEFSLALITRRMTLHQQHALAFAEALQGTSLPNALRISGRFLANILR